MRWMAKRTPEIGDTREVTPFAMLPICIGNTWAWLERYKRIDTYTEWTEERWSGRSAWSPITIKCRGWRPTHYELKEAP